MSGRLIVPGCLSRSLTQRVRGLSRRAEGLEPDAQAATARPSSVAASPRPIRHIRPFFPDDISMTVTRAACASTGHGLVCDTRPDPHMPQPVAPAAAAACVLARAGPPAAVEPLLLQRNATSKFAAGDYVFAGGKVETDDMPVDGEAFCRGLTAETAAARLGGKLSPREALSYWVGAIREAFEEIGVLLAYGPDDELLRITPDRRERYAGYRSATQKSNPAFFDMLRAERLTLATDRIVYFAHWITPEEQPIRFDTRFFAAAMPPGQEPTVDG